MMLNSLFFSAYRHTKVVFFVVQGVHDQLERLQHLLQRSRGGVVQPRAHVDKPLPLLERAGNDRQVSEGPFGLKPSMMLRLHLKI